MPALVQKCDDAAPGQKLAQNSRPANNTAFTRLDYDRCTYKHNLLQSIGPGEYQTQAPWPHCRECISDDPRIRLQKGGNAKCADVPLVDVESELHGITRFASKCPFDKYLPGGPLDKCELRALPTCRDDKLISEDTRLSNPPCTLRGTENGFNRWEWLCQNPQERVELPFDVQINTRTLAKDNHRPCVPTPIDQAAALPPHSWDPTPIPGTMPCLPDNFNHAFSDASVASTHWRPCAQYQYA